MSHSELAQFERDLDDLAPEDRHQRIHTYPSEHLPRIFDEGSLALVAKFRSRIDTIQAPLPPLALAKLKITEGRYPEAAAQLMKLWLINPSDGLTNFYLGIVYRNNERFIEEARAHFHVALDQGIHEALLELETLPPSRS